MSIDLDLILLTCLQSVSFDLMGWSVEQTPVKLLASLSHLAPLMDALTDSAIRYGNGITSPVYAEQSAISLLTC